jgi:hypothetical protein
MLRDIDLPLWLSSTRGLALLLEFCMGLSVESRHQKDHAGK